MTETGVLIVIFDQRLHQVVMKEIEGEVSDIVRNGVYPVSKNLSAKCRPNYERADGVNV